MLPKLEQDKIYESNPKTNARAERTFGTQMTVKKPLWFEVKEQIYVENDDYNFSSFIRF